MILLDKQNSDNEDSYLYRLIFAWTQARGISGIPSARFPTLAVLFCVESDVKVFARLREYIILLLSS